jgi:hypothetical protein
MDIQTALTIYAIGIPAWCFFMSFTGGTVDFAYGVSALIWPVMAIHVFARRLRRRFP